jgi:hypothetical protein
VVNAASGDTVEVSWGWPEDEDAVDAYLLTLRMFVQENDIIAVKRLPELYRALIVPKALIDKLSFARKKWLRFFRENSTLYTEGRGNYTNWEVLQLVLHGDRAHLDLDLRPTYESWYGNAGTRAMFETKLTEILDFLHVGIQVLRTLHAEIKPST